MSTYPDYAKSPPEYLAAIVSVIATYPLDIQSRLVDLRTGIPAKCKFLPTVADIVALADEFSLPKYPGIGLRDYSGLKVDTREYKPEIVPYISNREHRNPRYYEESKANEEVSKAGMLRAARMVAYVKTLGGGSAEKGWLIAIEQGIEEPPADFQVDTLVSK